MQDTPNLKDSLLYKLSLQGTLDPFQHVILVSSH